MHTVQERIQCDLCGSWLKNKYYFRGHYLTVHVKSVPVTCNVCGHTAPNKKALDSHQRTHRPDYRSFTCTACGRSFASNGVLINHMSTHSNARERPRCDNCSRSFSSQSAMKVNSFDSTLTHFGLNNIVSTFKFQRHTCTKPTEPTCKCPYCDRAYCTDAGVRTHVRRSHRAEENMRKESIKLRKLANLEKINNNAQPA